MKQPDASSRMPFDVALASTADPRDPAAFSGVVAGLVSGLEAQGYHAVPVVAQLPPRLHGVVRFGLASLNLRLGELRAGGGGFGPQRGRDLMRLNYTRLIANPTLARLRSIMVGRTLRRAGPLLGCIQFGGAEFWLPDWLPYPYVTYDDQTVVQARRSYPYQWLTALRHGEFERLVERQRRSYAHARACCVENEWAGSSIVEDFGVPPERVHVVGAGVSHIVEPAERDWSIPRFLFVGKDWQRKNGPKVIECFAKIRARVPLATLDVVGEYPPIGAPGVIEHGLIAPARPGEPSKLHDLYRRTTCLVIPSKHEPAAIAFLEAAYAGAGSIATSAGGSSTFVGDGGILVDPRRDDDLLAAMVAFTDPVAAREYGQRAAAHARLFTWPLVAGRLVRALTGSSDGPDFL